MVTASERRLLTAAIAGWLAIALVHLVFGSPLGHDEAAFAVSARGDGPAGLWLYRSEGTIAIARLSLAIGDADWQVRLASALVSVGFVLAVYAAGRAAFDRRVGAWAAVVVTGAHPIVMRGAELLSDLPSAACLVAGIALLAAELSREDGPRWRIAGVAPAFAAAFHIRYGSMPVIGLAGGAAAVLWWRAIVTRPLQVVATVVLFAALGPLPHVLHSLHATGSALGVLEVSTHMPRRAYVGQGLVGYFASNPFAMYGALPPLVIVGGFVIAIRRRLPEFRRRAPVLFAMVALGQLIALGIESDAQPRYVYVATSLLVVLGVAAVRHASRPRPRAALALAAVAWLGALVATVIVDRVRDDARAPIVAAGRAIRDDAAGQRCVFVAGFVPQLQWYARCDGMLAKAVGPKLSEYPRRYVVSVPGFPVAVASVAPDATPLPTADRRASLWRLP